MTRHQYRQYVEVAAFYMKYHSRLPLLSGRTGRREGVNAGDYASTASYFRDFPEDIKVAGFAVEGLFWERVPPIYFEYHYHWDQPMQIDDTELILAALSPLDSRGPIVFGKNQVGRFGFDQEITGWKRKDYSQAILKLSGASDDATIKVVAEASTIRVRGFEDPAKLRYDAPGTYTSGTPFFADLPPDGAGISPATNEPLGFADKYSWGYRFLVEYTSFMPNGESAFVTRLTYSNDVKGTTPGPLTLFVNNKKSHRLSTELKKCTQERASNESKKEKEWCTNVGRLVPGITIG